MQFHWPGFDVTKKLSAEEAAELAARVADLTKAGLPLGEGLRALAQELPGRRLNGVLLALADHLDAGVDLAEAVDSLGRQIPPHLRGLILAGLRGGHLSEVLEEYVDLERNQSELRHRLLMSMTYPVLLLAILTGVATFIQVCVVPQFMRMFRDFYTRLPDLTVAFANCSPRLVVCLFILLAVFMAMPVLVAAMLHVRWLGPVVYGIPIIGPMLRWNRAARCSRLLGMLLEQRMPLPDALQLTAGGLCDAHLAHGCRLLADDVEHGGILYESMAARPGYFPASMVPIIEWGQRTPALPDAFRAAAEMFEGRICRESSFLEAIFLPLTFLMIFAYVGTLVVAMFSPFLCFITLLSDGTNNMPPPDFTGAFFVFWPILLGIAVLVVQRIIAGRCDPPRRNPILSILALVGWTLFVAGSFWPLLYLWPLLLVFSPIIGFIVIEIYRRYRAAQQYAMLGLLTIATERSMPLAPAVEAFARERSGWFGRRAMRLAKLLRAGHSLPDALTYCHGLVPAYAMMTIRVGDDSDALVPALRQAAAKENISGPQAAALTDKIWYLFLLLFFGYGIFSFLVSQILPKFGKIFKDFDMKLPAMTQWLFDLSGNSLCVLFFLFFNLALIFLLAAVVFRYLGWVRDDLPGFSRLTRRLDSANILDGLALVAGQQRPMPDGIAALAREYPKWNIRRRLRRAANDVQAGRDWAESLLRRRLIGKPDLAILQSAQRANNLAWALHELADGNRRRFAYRLQAFLQLAYPPVILLFGAVVACIVIGMFIPLIALIQKLAV